MTYLDWASTSPPDPGILAEAAELAARAYGNPSSRHALGAEAKSALDEARSRLARCLGDGTGGSGRAAPESGRIAFTGGGSEADAIPLLAVLRAALAARRDGSIKALHVVSSEIEHAAVFEQLKTLHSLGIGLASVKAEADGRLDPARVAAAVRPETVLVAVMAVNNETGAIQPVAEIAGAVRAAAAALGKPAPRIHVDAVQALGKLPFRPAELGIDSAAFSAHKIRGPRGVGALWRSGGLESLVQGGGQEGGVRPGTESLQGAWAFARAAEAALAGLEAASARARLLEARLLAGLASIPGALPVPLGRAAGDPRYSPFIVSAAFPGLSGEVLARALSDAGIAVSTGAACSSNTGRKGRRVLEAMGLARELAASSIRVSFGPATGEAEVDHFLEAASRLYAGLRV